MWVCACLCACPCACVHVHASVCLRVCASVYVRVSVYLCGCTCLCVGLRACMHGCLCVHLCVCACVCTGACMSTTCFLSSLGRGRKKRRCHQPTEEGVRPTEWWGAESLNTDGGLGTSSLAPRGAASQLAAAPRGSQVTVYTRLLILGGWHCGAPAELNSVTKSPTECPLCAAVWPNMVKASVCGYVWTTKCSLNNVEAFPLNKSIVFKHESLGLSCWVF